MRRSPRLARRYFTSRGPATLGDFVWWSGLPASDARAGLEAVKPEFTREDIDGKTYWRSRFLPDYKERTQNMYLLPGFDEYILGYRDRSAFLGVLKEKPLVPKNGMPSPPIVINGRIAGTWKRTLEKSTVVIKSNPFTPFTTTESNVYAAASRRYGEFLGMPVVWE